MQDIEQWDRVFMPYRQALLGRTTADVIFDLIQTADARERLFGERRVLRDMHIKEMPPGVPHAGYLFDARSRPRLRRQEQRLEARVRIDLQLALKSRQVRL